MIINYKLMYNIDNIHPNSSIARLCRTIEIRYQKVLELIYAVKCVTLSDVCIAVKA